MEVEPLAVSAWLPQLLQTADPLFPTGAYAHSFGLEEMVRLGVVKTEAGLSAYMTDHLLPQLSGWELPALRFGIAAAADTTELLALDREIHAWKLPAEARTASIQIGARRIRTLCLTSGNAVLLAYDKLVGTKVAHGHHIIAAALQALVHSCPVEAALFSYGYQTCAGACTAALKLIRIGQEGTQRALTNALLELPRAVKESLTVERDGMASFSPMLEIASMRHAMADERLFIS
jgi:urease accessory protein